MLAVATPNAPAAELDAATLRGAVAGNDTATRALVEMYQVRVFALVSRMLVGRGRATVEDVAQVSRRSRRPARRAHPRR
jgi:hypothetical protein